jgi:hypothetical protein
MDNETYRMRIRLRPRKAVHRAGGALRRAVAVPLSVDREGSAGADVNKNLKRGQVAIC